MPYIGRGPAKSGAFRLIDSIASSFNGSTTGFTLQSNSSNITPGTEQNLLIAVDGVMQEPVDAFTISGSTITFTSAPASGASFWGVELGDVGGVASSVANGTVDIAHLSASGSAGSGTFLRGDNQWAAPSGGAALTGSTNNTVTTVTGANAITGEANLTFDGTNLTVGTGNVIIGTHGKGIDFAANTQDEIGGGSVSSEIFDDYEVGTFTPALTDSSGVERQHSGSGKFGHYTKIGNRVFFNLRVVIVGAGSATGSSLAQIRGLPFVCDSTANSETGFPIGYAAAMSITATASLIGLSDANGNSHMYIKIWDTSGGTTNATLNQLTTDATLNVAGQYEVD